MEEVSALPRERYNELLGLPYEVDSMLNDGAARLLPIVTETMREVKEKVGWRRPNRISNSLPKRDQRDS
jgi:hypothetical protein